MGFRLEWYFVNNVTTVRILYVLTLYASIDIKDEMEGGGTENEILRYAALTNYSKGLVINYGEGLQNEIIVCPKILRHPLP